jgi:hypothetical protein
MIELKLKIWDIDGSERIVFDYLLEAMGFKLRHFSKICNLLDKYESGVLAAEDCVGKSGNLELIVQQGQPRIDGGYYPSKNSVKDYVESQAVVHASEVQHQSEHPLLDDAIPF